MIFVHNEGVVDLVIGSSDLRSSMYSGRLTLKSSCMNNPVTKWIQSGMAMCWVVSAWVPLEMYQNFQPRGSVKSSRMPQLRKQ